MCSQLGRLETQQQSKVWTLLFCGLLKIKSTQSAWNAYSILMLNTIVVWKNKLWPWKLHQLKPSWSWLKNPGYVHGHRRFFQTTKVCTVTKTMPCCSSKLKCSGLQDTQDGVACQHIFVVLLFFCLCLYNTLYFNEQWLHRFTHNPAPPIDVSCTEQQRSTTSDNKTASETHPDIIHFSMESDENTTSIECDENMVPIHPDPNI